MKNSSLEGKIVELLYPMQNEVGVKPRLKTRKIMVESVRDLLSEPLLPEDVARRPYVRRGRYLLIGMDIDKQEPRQFYLDWNQIQQLEVVHGDGAKTKIRSGKTRYERTCFGEICQQLSSTKGLRVTIRKAA